MKFRKKPVVIEAITFEEFVEYGKNNGGNIVNGFPWHFKYKGHPVTHEHDECYLIPTLEGTHNFTPQDMLITGVKGEIYPCKIDIFEATYDRVDQSATEMSFGQALGALKIGHKVARSGWNGKGMWVVRMPELKLPSFNTQEAGPKVNDRTAKHIGADTPLNSQPYFAMWNAQGQWQPGWQPSAADCLADDWSIVH